MTPFPPGMTKSDWEHVEGREHDPRCMDKAQKPDAPPGYYCICAELRYDDAADEADRRYAEAKDEGRL